MNVYIYSIAKKTNNSHIYVICSKFYFKNNFVLKKLTYFKMKNSNKIFD